MAMFAFSSEGVHYQLVSFGNGAGLYKRLDEFEEALKSANEEPTFGSITRLFREGNTGGDIFYYDEQTDNHINSIGLANSGWRKYKRMRLVEKLVALARKYGKKIRISVSGFSAHDYMYVVREIAEIIVRLDAQMWVTIEINFSCPNTVDSSGQHHPITAYEPRLVMHIVGGLLWTMEKICGEKRHVALAFKFSPYNHSDTRDFGIPKMLCNDLNYAARFYVGSLEVVLCNTIGGQSMFKPDGSPALGVTNNVGGQGGKVLKPRSIDNVTYFRDHLLERITVVGVGGVTSGEDVFDYVTAGAAKVQATGYVAKYGLGVFGKMFDELVPMAA
jgi:dihydroorotate dehydrogenase (fumarate)